MVQVVAASIKIMSVPCGDCSPSRRVVHRISSSAQADVIILIAVATSVTRDQQTDIDILYIIILVYLSPSLKNKIFFLVITR